MILLFFVYLFVGACMFYIMHSFYTNSLYNDEWFILLYRKYISKPVVFISGFIFWPLTWFALVLIFIVYMFIFGFEWAFNYRIHWWHKKLNKLKSTIELPEDHDSKVIE